MIARNAVEACLVRVERGCKLGEIVKLQVNTVSYRRKRIFFLLLSFVFLFKKREFDELAAIA